MPAKPKQIREPKTRRVSQQTRRKALEAQLSDITREIVRWRDADVYCVLKGIDGGHCRGDPQWSHLYSQNQSPWLRWELGNSYLTCRGHNFLHGPIRRSPNYQSVYYTWFCSMWGSETALAFNREWLAHINSKGREIFELEALLERYDELYQNRFYVPVDRVALVNCGYYGEIIRRNFCNE